MLCLNPRSSALANPADLVKGTLVSEYLKPHNSTDGTYFSSYAGVLSPGSAVSQYTPCVCGYMARRRSGYKLSFPPQRRTIRSVSWRRCYDCSRNHTIVISNMFLRPSETGFEKARNHGGGTWLAPNGEFICWVRPYLFL